MLVSKSLASTSGLRSKYSRANAQRRLGVEELADVGDPLRVLPDHRGQGRELLGDRVERDR